MLIIYPKPEKDSEFHTLAVNLKTIDEIVMFKVDVNAFSLSIVKLFDAHNSNQSRWQYTLGTFESIADCLVLFENIVDALNAGQKTFELPPLSLPLQPEDSDPRDQRSAYN